jgi:hypothetical protein
LAESPASLLLAPVLLAPRSIDMVRLIRRSMRCFIFGLLGLIPFFGVGFAYQALRLRRAISADIGDAWDPPPVYCYWVIGLVAVIAAWSWITVTVAMLVFLAVVALQTWHCWRSFRAAPEAIWNPGRQQLFWGVIFAYAGLGLSLWALVLTVLLVAQSVQAV